MLINEVEHLVGLSKKSIRLYEEEGLLIPKRNTLNDYREYDTNDVEKLKVIKFLRELGVPIKDLKALENESMLLSECMLDRINKIKSEETKFFKVKEMCQEIIDSNRTYKDIDIQKYYEEMNILGKEGFTLRDVKTNKSKKIWGACLSTLIFSALMLFIVGIVVYFQITEAEKMPWILFIFTVVLLSAPVLATIVNLIARIKEINGGEEDEASKY